MSVQLPGGYAFGGGGVHEGVCPGTVCRLFSVTRSLFGRPRLRQTNFLQINLSKSGLGQVELAETNNVSSKRNLQENGLSHPGLGQVELAETSNVSSKRDLQENGLSHPAGPATCMGCDTPGPI